jgi:formate-dependent nitrite reductase membrane component NrfD
VARFYLVMRPTSPMSWGAWILAGLYPAAVLFNIAAMTDSEVKAVGRPLRIERLLRKIRDWGARRMRSIARINLILGIALGAYTGILLGTLAARAAWNSVMLAPLFLVSGISAGAAMVLLFPIDKVEESVVTRWDLWAIGAEVVLLGLFFLDLYAGGGAPGKAATALFWGGQFTAVFWALVVAAGLVVPWILESTGHRRGLSPTLAAPVLVLGGGLALRWIVVAAGQV